MVVTKKIFFWKVFSNKFQEVKKFQEYPSTREEDIIGDAGTNGRTQGNPREPTGLPTGTHGNQREHTGLPMGTHGKPMGLPTTGPTGPHVTHETHGI